MKFIVSLIIVFALCPIWFATSQAGTIVNGTNYTNVNYTNIFTDESAMDIVRQAREFVFPKKDLDFGITIAKTCYQMHKHNVTTDCPTYEAIMAIFPDTSDKTVSGEFIIKDGFLQRDRPQMEDHYRYYDFMEDRTILFIDPDAQLMKELSMITIYAHLPEYPINYKVVDNTRTMGVGRYIDNCRNAVIDGPQWVFLIGDTMEYIRHDCHETFTLFSGNVTYYQEKIEHDITTSAKWLHDAFLQYVNDNCLGVYDKC